MYVLIFSDINPSSWREGDALVRRLLGPVRHVKMLHSPPTRDVLKQDSSADAQLSMFLDDQSKPAVGGVVPSSVQDSDALPVELEQSSENVQQEAATASAAERLSSSVDEVVDSAAGVDTVSGQHQPVPVVTNSYDFNIVEPTIHRISLKLPGDFFCFIVTCDCQQEC